MADGYGGSYYTEYNRHDGYRGGNDRHRGGRDRYDDDGYRHEGRSRGRGRGGGRRGGRGRGGGRGGGGGHPSGLSGKAIGMYYAQKQKQKNEQNRTVAHIPDGQMDKLSRIQHKIDMMEGYDTERIGEVHNQLAENHAANEARDRGEDLSPRKNADRLDDKLEYVVVSGPAGRVKEPDEKLPAQLAGRRNEARHAEMEKFRRLLPAHKMKDELLDLVSRHQVVVVSGETGCGKTTQVPQFILEREFEEGRGSGCRIVCTQPRRISAITVAERVADERGEKCGQTVGYQIRLESRLPRSSGSILYCTTGVVLQWLRSVPQLDTISHIILDEIHERDMQSDFLITILKDLLPKRPDLKVILMSATLNAEKFSKYFHGCPMIEIPGFTFPVTEYYLEDVLEMTRFQFNRAQIKQEPVWMRKRRGGGRMDPQEEYEENMGPFLRHLDQNRSYSRSTMDSLWNKDCEALNMDLTACLVNHIHDNEPDGAILVFVPGWKQISTLHNLLKSDRMYRLKGSTEIHPVHSLMPTTSQRKIFSRPPRGVRKIVLATNIAETSITIDDVVYVVDCGRIKITNFDKEANISTLQPEWVSIANARQRRGRAGRVQPGKCYHLYHKGREALLDQYLKPEILRTRLDEVILQLKILELGSCRNFLGRVIDPPDEQVITLSLELLASINAITFGSAGEKLTPLGYHLAQLPLDPQTGKMILLGAIFSCLDPVLSVAASLNFKDAFVIPLGKEEEADRRRVELAGSTRSDHLMLANAIEEWENSNNRSQFCWDYFLSESVLKMLTGLKGQFAEHLHRKRFLATPDVFDRDANRNSGNEALVRAVICAGLYPNVAKIYRFKKNPRSKTKMQTPTDKRALFHPKSVNFSQTKFPYPWIVYHLKQKSTEIYLYDSSVVSPLSLLFFGKHVRYSTETLSNGQSLDTVSADDYVKFNCQKSVAVLVKVFRKELDDLLLYKVMHPSPTVWDQRWREGTVLAAIVELLNTEMIGGQMSEEEDDDDDY